MSRPASRTPAAARRLCSGVGLALLAIAGLMAHEYFAPFGSPSTANAAQTKASDSGTAKAPAAGARNQPKPGVKRGAKNQEPQVNGLELAPKQLETLLAGVTEISTAGAPGPLCVYGPLAFPVVVDVKEGRRVPLVAAAGLDKGRLVAFAHHSYFGDLPGQHAMTGKLVANCVAWAAARNASNAARVSVAVRGYAPLRKHLSQAGFQVAELPNQNWVERIAGAQVVVADLQECSASDLQVLHTFVKQGGGLLAANLIWAWKQSHADADPATEHPGNQLYSTAGITWSDGTSPSGYGAKVKTSVEPDELSHVRWCLDAIDRMADKQRTLSSSELSQIANTLSDCYDSIPRERDAGVFARLEELLAKFAKQLPTPSEATPIAPQQGEQRLLVSIQNQILCHVSVADLKPAPSAADFPGLPSVKPKRTSRKVSLRLDRSGWRSTGLYAAPGERIVVKTDAATAKRGLSLQIGSHSDSLSKVNAPWKRPPEMTRRFPLNRPSQEIGHAYGGLVYIDVPEKAMSSETCAVEFTGAVEAPYYVHGTTTRSQWEKIKLAPAPWAELETENLVITVPSELIRGLPLPEALMDHWTKVVDACADLATIPHERKKPERMVFDVQISAGFLHSGYPIMGHLKPTAPEVVNIDYLLTKGGWGFYHELGHNHQQGAWTFDGTVEVTCNLFSLYVLETLSPRAYKHQAIELDKQRERERAYIAGGAKFSQWKSDPFLALTMYIQMQEAFGWEPFKKVFAEYRALPPSEQPKTDDEKRDQWLVRFSRTVGKNLGPFFEHWGVPTSTAARQSIENLPTWMPPRS